MGSNLHALTLQGLGSGRVQYAHDGMELALPAGSGVRPFAPEIVLPTVEDFTRWERAGVHRYGFKATFNPTFPFPASRTAGYHPGTLVSTKARSS